jgi:hypothetical protein
VAHPGPPSQSGGFRNKKGHISLWRLPDGLFETRGYFLGEIDLLVSKLTKVRAAVGLAILVFIAYAYPGYTGPVAELYPTTGSVWPGVRTLLKFDSIWLQSAIYTFALVVLLSMLFCPLMIVFARSSALPTILNLLCWSPVTIVVFIGMCAMLGAAIERLPQTGGWVLLSVPVAAVLLFLLLKSVYLAATGVFRADDAHPLLAPLATTGASWWLAVSLGEPPGLPLYLRLAATYTGPLILTGLNACAYTDRRAWQSVLSRWS